MKHHPRLQSHRMDYDITGEADVPEHPTLSWDKKQIASTNPMDIDCIGCALHLFFNQWAMRDLPKRGNAYALIEALIESAVKVVSEAPDQEHRLNTINTLLFTLQRELGSIGVKVEAVDATGDIERPLEEKGTQH
jgi:hypothetical protein